MVKLRITVRVLTKEADLTITDSSYYVLLDGEKRFDMIIKNPESCSIRKLEQIISDRYKMLYQEELGETELIRDNANNADLLLNDFVLDAVITEGKTIPDNSYQHATIRVITNTAKPEFRPSVPISKSQTPALESVEHISRKRKLDETITSAEDNRRSPNAKVDASSHKVITTSESRATHRKMENGLNKNPIATSQVASARHPLNPPPGPAPAPAPSPTKPFIPEMFNVPYSDDDDDDDDSSSDSDDVRKLRMQPVRKRRDTPDPTIRTVYESPELSSDED